MNRNWNNVNISYAFHGNTSIIQIMFNQSNIKHYNGIMKKVISDKKEDIIMTKYLLKNDKNKVKINNSYYYK